MNKKLYIYMNFGISIFLLFILCPTINYAIENSECIECHSDESLHRSIEQQVSISHMRSNLYIDEDKFNNSVHNINGITCIDCHDDIEELNYDEEVPHSNNITTGNSARRAILVNAIRDHGLDRPARNMSQNNDQYNV